MSTHKHTPGPWKATISKSRIDGVAVVFRIDCAKRISIVGGQSQEHLGRDGVHEEECRANAQLIAAAPELLEALQIARDYAAFANAEPDDLALIDAALTKATGGAA